MPPEQLLSSLVSPELASSQWTINAREEEIEKRRRSMIRWTKLAESVYEARNHLKGDDLTVFEAMISKPKPGVNHMEWIRRWVEANI